MKSNDKFYLDKYFKYREWIWDRRTDGFEWKKITHGLRDNVFGLIEFLAQQRQNMLWDIKLTEWLDLVEFEKEMEELELEAKL